MDGSCRSGPRGSGGGRGGAGGGGPARPVRLVDELRGIVGERVGATRRAPAADLRVRRAAPVPRSTPAAAVLPGTAEEVQAVVRACARGRASPWVARGAGSGLSGGALPIADGVLIVVSRMKRVLEVDLDNHRICVEPGVTNANVSAAVGPDFFYPPDPSSQIVCSIGGNVAENSGGAHCFKYGFTTNYVTGLEVVLADGEMVQIGGHELDPPGLRPARRVRRLRGHARHRDQGVAAGRARRPRRSRRWWRSSTPRARRARRCRRSCRRASCRARSR